MPNYANINNVYNIVKEVLNKSQLGFISPAQFNIFAPQVEAEFTDEIIEQIQQYVKTRLRHQDDENNTIIKGLRDDIATLFVYNEAQVASSGDNIFDFPSRYYYLESITYTGLLVEVVKPSQIPFISNNYYTPPSLSFPLAVLATNKIEIIPNGLLEGIKMNYYKNPMGSQNGLPVNFPPSWEHTQVGEDLLYNSTDSVDFELPKTVEHKLAYKVLALAGFSIREPEAVSFANSQEQKDKVTENS